MLERSWQTILGFATLGCTKLYYTTLYYIILLIPPKKSVVDCTPTAHAAYYGRLVKPRLGEGGEAGWDVLGALLRVAKIPRGVIRLCRL